MIWSRLVPGVEYTFDEVNRLLDRGPNTKSSQGKILSAIANGELTLTLDWKIKRRLMSELTIQMTYTLEQVAATIADLVECRVIAAGLYPPGPQDRASVTIYVRAAMASWIELNYQAVIAAPEVKDLFKIPELKEIKVRYYDIPRRDNPRTYFSVTIRNPT